MDWKTAVFLVAVVGLAVAALVLFAPNCRDVQSIKIGDAMLVAGCR